MAKMYGKAAIESEEQQKLRWQVELEFVQCLANPNYLNFLAQRGYFKDQAFINYLKYLQYWKEPEYAKYIMYPLCLYFLDLLQYEHFRREIVNSQCCKFIDDQIILHWQHYTRKRTKLLNAFSNINSKNASNGTQEANDTQQVQLASSQPVNSSNSNSSHTTQQHNVLNGNAGSVTNATPTTPQTQQQQINGTSQIQSTPATMVSAIMQKI